MGMFAYHLANGHWRWQSGGRGWRQSGDRFLLQIVHLLHKGCSFSKSFFPGNATQEYACKTFNLGFLTWTLPVTLDI